MTTEYDAYKVQYQFQAIASQWYSDAVSVTYFNSDGQAVVAEGDIRQICREIVKGFGKPGVSFGRLHNLSQTPDSLFQLVVTNAIG